MAKSKIILSTSWTNDVMSTLRDKYDVICPNEGHHFSPQDILDNIGEAEAYCPVFYDEVGSSFIKKLPQTLKIIASCGVGTNHIDVGAALGRGLTVTNTPDVLTIETADLTVGLMIATTRKFFEREKTLREGGWKGPRIANDLGMRVSGKTLGIIGLGRIGKAVAQRAKAFDMKILYHSRNRKTHLEEEIGMDFRKNINDIFIEADIISLHTALTNETHHIVNKKTLSLMKPSAILINTGRGKLVDEKALIKALQENQIAGAGLDVYENEPQIPPELRALENATLLPHIGSATQETRNAMGFKVKENLDAFFEGKDIPNSVTE